MEQGLNLFDRRNNRVSEDLKSLPDEAKMLLDVIDLMPTMVGAPIFTKDDEWLIVMIAKFIVNEYPKLKVYDIQKAFSMGAKRELRNEKHDVVDISTFGQKVSVNLVGRVLNAYEEHKRIDRMRGSNMFPSGNEGQKKIESPKNEPEKMTPKIAYNMLVDECRSEGKLPKHFYLYSMVYRYVKKHRGRYLFDLWGKKELKKIRAKAGLTVSTKDGAMSLSNRLNAKKSTNKQFMELCVKKYFNEVAIPKIKEGK